MPELIVASNLLLAINHILWWWVVFIYEFRSQIKKYGSSVPIYLFKS
jgi:hypothetical protein